MSFTVNLHEKTRNIQENIVNHPIRLIAIIPLIFVFISCSGNSNLDNLSGNIPIDPIAPQEIIPLPPDPGTNLSPGQPHEQMHGSQNIFTIEEPRLQSCLIQVLGEKRYYELSMVPPNPEDMLKIGPCMPLVQASHSLMEKQAPSNKIPSAPGQSHQQMDTSQNIFTIEEPGLQSCLIQVLGEKRYYELRMMQPSREEMSKIGPCMPLAQESTSPKILQAPSNNKQIAPEQRLPPTSAGTPPPPPSSQLSLPTAAGDHMAPSSNDSPWDNHRDPNEIVSVKKIDTSYRVAAGNTNGTFKHKQSADIVLSAFGFNETGGALSFNRNSGIATDGVRLVLADTFNNRILIWNKLPSDNVPPDIVLGQTDFNTNNPGNSPSQMNWPISVSLASNKLVVTDTYNDRILIWNSFPTSNGQPADLIINNTGPKGQATKRTVKWPWGIWTDGNKMAIANTGAGSALIWNSFPTSNNQPADILLTGNGNFGTPRQITSNGQSLIIGDHNSKDDKDFEIGSYVFNDFPTKDETMYDFFMYDSIDPRGGWSRGAFLDDGRLALFGRTLFIYDTIPTSNASKPTVTVDGYNFTSGDYPGVAAAGDKLYISTGNGNKIVVYNSIPTRPDQDPDFAIGSPDLDTNTLVENYIIGNPVSASNGTNLLVSSDFDKKLYLWNQRPDESGVHPDAVYEIPEAPWDNALWENNFVLGGKKGVYIFESIPDGTNLPDKTYQDSIGNANFKEIRGIAIDDKYLYVGDIDANKVYVWEGIPDKTSNPKFTLDVASPTRMSSDGEYLAVTSTSTHTVSLFNIDRLSSDATGTKVGGHGIFNLPEGTNISNNMLFVADTGNNKVAIWTDIYDALAGKSYNTLIGAENREIPEIGKDSLFWPGTVFYDDDYLWVGEFKFSNRLLRYSPSN